MFRKFRNIFLFLGLLFWFSGCNTAKLFYDYADTLALWQLDSYFYLTNAQEDWVQERLRKQLQWHRTQELPRYAKFLEEIQERAKDGVTMSELDEGFSRVEAKWGRTMEHLIPDAALFLTKISPQQIDYLEQQMLEENEEMAEKLESRQERLQKRQEEFWDEMENWFGDFSDSQRSKISAWQSRWLADSPDRLAERLERRRQTQPQFLALLRSSPEAAKLEKWLLQRLQNWNMETSERQTRILRNKQRILQVDAVLTSKQRLHAVRELGGWLKTIKQTIPNH